MNFKLRVLLLSGMMCLAPACLAQGDPEAEGELNAEELAKKLSNPIASLISFPMQLNYDDNIGPVDEGSQIRLNVQPVIPVSLNDEWNVISRTILPILIRYGFESECPGRFPVRPFWCRRPPAGYSGRSRS